MRRGGRHATGVQATKNEADGHFQHSLAEVVEWQTRTFEGRVAQAVRVQVPPSAPILYGNLR